MSLFHADSYSPDDMVVHPRHQAMQPVLVQLIQQLRDCETVEAGVEFQRALLARLLEVEKDRWEFKRAATRSTQVRRFLDAVVLQPARRWWLWQGPARRFHRSGTRRPAPVPEHR